MALLAVLTGCNSSEAFDDTTTSVSAQLGFAVSQVSTPTTRQGGDVVQTTKVRGIDTICFIPFGSPFSGKIVATDEPKDMTVIRGSSRNWYEKTGARFFLSQGVILTPGTASFLVYGRAAKTSPTATNAENGVLLTNLWDGETIPSVITFSLKQMCPTTVVPAEAQALAAYLNRIARAQTTIDGVTYSWKNSTNSLLKILYRNFTAQNEDFSTAAKLAGSSNSVLTYVDHLKFTLNNQSQHFIGDATSTAIKDAILAEINNTTGVPTTYPTSVGLPDGAAVLKWTTEEGFVPQVETSTEAAINNINRYCYPAELCYYANSLIKTSQVDVAASNYSNIGTWPLVLEKYTDDEVTSDTRSVAITDPLQYAVGCLQVTLKKTEATTLKDSEGQDVAVTETAFPLTGIIVSGQHTVDFNFTPIDSPDRFIYDSQLKTTKADGTQDYIYLSPTVEESSPAQTLVLQSKEDDNEVKIILEFQNNSDMDFFGVDGGVIYRGTKFYMAGSVKRPAQRTQDYENRVFTQDYITSLSMKIVSLKDAYTVLPDLLAPNLELGVQITKKWVQSTSTTVVLK